MDMVNLPYINDHMEKREFSVQIGSSNVFGRIPVNQAVQEIVNEDTQTAGGTKGFSLNQGTVKHYHMT